MEDSRIVELFFERSEQAIEELSRKYGRVCRKIADNILNNAQDAEECVNDAYLGAWNSIPPEKPDPLLPYICRIVRNLSVKRYHANTAAKRRSMYDAVLEELEACIPSAETVETACESRALSAALDAFLESLSEEDRVLFMRRYWYSEPVREIAETLSVTAHNAAVRLSRIRKKLKKYLTEEGFFL